MSEDCEQSGKRVWRYGEPVGAPAAQGAATTVERVTGPGCGGRVLMHVGSGVLFKHEAAERAA